MAYIELTPINITTSSSAFSDAYNIISSDDLFAEMASGTTPTLYARFGIPELPKDTTVTGVEIFYSARTSGSASNSALKFNYFIANTQTAVASSKYSVALTNTEASGYVGSSSDTFEYPLRRLDVHGNAWFGITITASSSVSVPIWIDQIYTRVHYSTNSYLTGTRSRFTGQQGTLYDVDMVNGVAQSGSLIKRKYNGASIESQIKAEDINLLGDALYNVESAVLSSTGTIHTTDGQKTYVFSLAISGYANALASTDVIIYAKTKTSASGVTALVNLTSSYITMAPFISGAVSCYFTSAIAWIEDGAGNKNHIYAHPGGAYFKRNGATTEFAISVSALASSIGTYGDYDDSEGTTGAYQGYIGSTFTAPSASGKIHFRIFAMGREV